MNPGNLGMGAKIAGAGALVLIISMFLPWYDVSVEGFGSGDADAWQVFSLIDILLFASSVLVLVVVGAKAAGSALPLPGPLVMLAAGGASLVFIVYRLIDTPGPEVPSAFEDAVDVSPTFGLFIGLVAAAAIAYGGFRSMSES